MEKETGEGKGCISQDLVCQLAANGYKPKPKGEIIKGLLGDSPHFVQDAWDTCVNSPFGASLCVYNGETTPPNNLECKAEENMVCLRIQMVL
jgi:hypothetical protein